MEAHTLGKINYPPLIWRMCAATVSAESGRLFEADGLCLKGVVVLFRLSLVFFSLSSSHCILGQSKYVYEMERLFRHPDADDSRTTFYKARRGFSPFSQGKKNK